MSFKKFMHKFQNMFMHGWKKIKRLHKNFVLKRLAGQEKIFILGLQKSGTTAIAALLSEATGRSVTLDIVRSIKRPGSGILRRYGVEGFDDHIYRYRREFSNMIVKEPGLTFDFHQLKAYFPRARFVMIIREPKDNIRSILNRLKLPGDLSSLNVEEWPELRRSPAWRINLDSSWLGYCQKTYVDSQAYRWRLAAETYFSNSESFVLVRYEDFLDDKVISVETLAESLGLQVIGDISGVIDNQYQPKGQRVSDYNNFYGENLKYIEEHCASLAKELGYEV